MKNHKRSMVRSCQAILVAFIVAATPFVYTQEVSATQNLGVNGRIAYSKYDGSNTEQIFSVKADGSDQRQLSNNTYPLYGPKYSPDGTKIGYLASVAPTVFFKANADGSNEQTVGDGGNFVADFDWRQNNMGFIVSDRTASPSRFNITSLDANGNNPTILTNFAHNARMPQVSPDGTKIAYQSSADNDIHVMNIDGTGDVNITNGATTSSDKPSWSPDGTKIVYIATNLAQPEAVAVMNADGSGKIALADGSYATFSPDGTKIAFSNVNGELRIINSNGTNDQLILTDDVRGVTWQSLNLGPQTTNNLMATISNGKATVNIAGIFSDPYGGMIDKSSIAITAGPTKGTTSIDTTNGVITYSVNVASTGQASWYDRLASSFSANASAASSDQFSFRVCSTTASTLCTTSTVQVLAGAPDTGAGLPINTVLSDISLIASLGTVLAGIVLYLRARTIRQDS